MGENQGSSLDLLDLRSLKISGGVLWGLQLSEVLGGTFIWCILVFGSLPKSTGLPWGGRDSQSCRNDSPSCVWITWPRQSTARDALVRKTPIALIP